MYLIIEIGAFQQMLRKILRILQSKPILLPFFIESFICRNISRFFIPKCIKTYYISKKFGFQIFQNHQICPWKCAKYWQWVIHHFNIGSYYIQHPIFGHFNTIFVRTLEGTTKWPIFTQIQFYPSLPYPSLTLTQVCQCFEGCVFRN